MIKLAFSTLGCPEWSFEEILAAGQRYEFDGIEFRGVQGNLDLVNAPEFAPAQIAETRRRIEDAGLRASCLSSSVVVVASTVTEVDQQQAIAHAQRYVEMAHQIGAPCVRLFCGEWPATLEHGAALDRAADTLRRIGDFAHARGVTAAVETHDAFIRTELLMELILLANHPAVQVLWDIHHPYRIAGESVLHSMHYLDRHIAATHVKDSVLNADGESYTYVLTGDGDVPIFEAMHALRGINYNGYFTLEWEKRWVPELADPAVAFPQYVEQMRAWEKQLIG